MSYLVAKYILWICLCIPIGGLIFYFLYDVVNMAIKIRRKRKREEKMISNAQNSRKRFDMDYEEYLKMRKEGRN